MGKKETELLGQILEKLDHIDPPVKKFPVSCEDPEISVYLVDLADVCYITTKNDHGRDEVAFITAKETFYSNEGLKDIEEQLKDHPHFMRSSKYYIINLSRIKGLKVNNARDLWFEGLKNPITNGVTSTYLEEFEKRLK
jgi:DNA-binding LytR/AlgR family response regulator